MPEFKNIIIGAGGVLTKQGIWSGTLSSFDNDTPIEQSPLGTPVYDNITLGSINDKESNKYLDIAGNEQSFVAMKFNEVLLDVSNTKRIISTPVRGRDGDIKQYISRGDYSILISGKVSGGYNQFKGTWFPVASVGRKYFPERELKWLIDICKAGFSVPISSAYLNNIFGINKIVITNYQLTQEEGNRYSQRFEINCLSDRDVILEFTEEQVNDSEQLNNILGV